MKCCTILKAVEAVPQGVHDDSNTSRCGGLPPISSTVHKPPRYTPYRRPGQLGSSPAALKQLQQSSAATSAGQRLPAKTAAATLEGQPTTQTTSAAAERRSRMLQMVVGMANSSMEATLEHFQQALVTRGPHALTALNAAEAAMAKTIRLTSIAATLAKNCQQSPGADACGTPTQLGSSSVKQQGPQTEPFATPDVAAETAAHAAGMPQPETPPAPPRWQQQQEQQLRPQSEHPDIKYAEKDGRSSDTSCQIDTK